MEKIQNEQKNQTSWQKIHSRELIEIYFYTFGPGLPIGSYINKSSVYYWQRRPLLSHCLCLTCDAYKILANKLFFECYYCFIIMVLEQFWNSKNLF